MYAYIYYIYYNKKLALTGHSSCILIVREGTNHKNVLQLKMRMVQVWYFSRSALNCPLVTKRTLNVSVQMYLNQVHEQLNHLSVSLYSINLKCFRYIPVQQHSRHVCIYF